MIVSSRVWKLILFPDFFSFFFSFLDRCQICLAHLVREYKNSAVRFSLVSYDFWTTVAISELLYRVKSIKAYKQKRNMIYSVRKRTEI